MIIWLYIVVGFFHTHISAFNIYFIIRNYTKFQQKGHSP